MKRGRRLSRKMSIKSWRHAVTKGAKKRIKMMRGGIRL